MDVLTELVNIYVRKLVNGVIEKSRYMCCFTCIAKEYDEERVKLEAELECMRQRVVVAMERGKDIQLHAQFWEKHVERLILEDTKTKKRCFFGFCSDCIWRYKRGGDLANKIKEIKAMMEYGEKFEDVEDCRFLLPGVERYSSQYYISFKSRELMFKELLDALEDDRNYIVGLHGMGGTGKTTLAKEVGKQLKTLQRFDHVIDTTVSYTPDIIKIQDDIAGSLGLELRDNSESHRPKKLWHRLTNGEKILVILDDVVGNLNFYDIGLPTSDNHKGCKVLVTTRNLGVCSKMGCEKTIQLELLSEEEAWAMFKMHSNLSNSSAQIFLDKGRKIATECKRLPFAIATIACTLKGQKHREEWDVVLNSLQKPVSMGIVDDNLVDIFNCLKLSYDFLEDEKAKGLFLLCAAFLKDEEFSNEILTRLGIGVGLFGECHDCYDDARSQAIVTKNKLLDSCLLLETKKGDLKMHDLVHEVAKWVANKEIQIVNLSNKNEKSLVEREKNIKYLSCEGNLKDLFSFEFDGSKLEMLIVNMNLWGIVDIPISFFGRIFGLRVLNLSNKSTDLERPTLSLPQSIKSLTNIRSLLVERVNLGDISVLGSLQSLETLDLDHCEIDLLPCEITELEKLRLLNLDQCEIRSNNPFEVIQRCSSLEELYFCNSFNGFCQEITLPTMQRYRLNKGFDSVNDSLSKCVSVEWINFSEATFKYVMQTAELIQLERIKKGWRNLMPEIVPIDQGMNHLTELRLKYDSQLQYLVDTKLINSQVLNVFSNLMVLHLEEMESLEELCNGPISFGSMNRLKELYIKHCQNLQSLFKSSLNLCNLKTITLESCSTLVSVFELSSSQCLPLLENLKISNCEQMENIFTYERRVGEIVEEMLVDGGDYDNKSCSSMFPKLKVLDIQGCPQLQCILPFLSAGDLLLLEVVIIDCCQKLEYIFGKQQDFKLASLKEMVIGNSPNFIDIFPESSQSTPSSKGSSNSISKPQTKVEPDKSNKIPLISEDQPNDRPISLESMSYSLNMWERGQCLSRLSHILSNIKVISLVNLSKIKSVFILSTAPIMSLESLTIKNCDELEHIIVDIGDGNGGNNSGNNVFPRLKELNIRKCQKLEYIFGHIDASDDHQNQNEVTHLPLPTLECLQLCGLPSLISICTKNYATTFPPLKVLELVDCPQVDIETVGDFTVPYSISTSQDITTIKDLSGNVVEHFQSLEKVKVNNSKVDSILCLNEVSERQMNLGLQNIELHNLPIMTCLFVGPKNSFALKNLKRIKIVRCEKLEIVFSTSISSCLPQLLDLRIEECEELRHIIKDDFENQRMSKNLSSNICFPKLQALAVENCNKLKCVFPTSISKELPELEVLLIRDAFELEVVFKSEGDDQKIEIPNLKVLAFVNLPSLSHIQGIQFQAVKNRFIQNCQKLSLTSSTPISIDDIFNKDDIDHETRGNMFGLFQQLRKEAKDQELTSSQELLNKQSTSRQILMDQQHLLEDDATVKLPQEYGDGQIAIPSLSISTREPVTIEDVDLEDSKKTTQINNQVSLNDDASMKANSNIMEQLPKDEEILVSRTKISSASQFPSMYSKGDTSQTVDDLISLLVTRELEQLVSKKHLDYANLSLLTDFLVKHPSVLLRDNSLSNRYKGYAYNCLAELLKFLQIHSVLDVLGSSHSEFVELVQDLRKFSFDKHWLDGVERRALFPDLQFSQDALQKLLDSKQQVTKAVEEMRSKIKKFNQHVEGLQHKLTSTEAVLESIVQQETKIRETKVALSAPLGY